MNKDEKISYLEKNLDSLSERLKKCDICPRECGVNRFSGEVGYCGVGADLIVYTAFAHYGEEPAISGQNGSGAIFFSGCNLKCVYCQNHKFSHSQEGENLTEAQLATIMLCLQEKGAHNINLVTPTHYLVPIMRALLIAFKEGLVIPIIYNTSGYEKKEIIEIINDIIDIYLIDMKYMVSELSNMYSHARDYPVNNQKVIKLIYNKKPNVFNGALLEEGVVIRHLVLPSHFEETIRALSWVKENTPDVLLSLMFQYQPYFIKASSFQQIDRRVNVSEYNQIKDFLEDLKLKGWVQDLSPQEYLAGVHFDPEFSALLNRSNKDNRYEKD
ncbi:MAG: radical SAM protein [Candidatus Omnitrophica bacterium]|nr:radical SAM protein [Candidatus Omnitrophota bacterium]